MAAPSGADAALVEKVARAICRSIIEGNVLGGTHTVWTDWQPEAKAAIEAVRGDRNA